MMSAPTALAIALLLTTIDFAAWIGIVHDGANLAAWHKRADDRIEAPVAAQSDLASYDPARLGALRYRMIGPARGGRVTAVTGVNQEPMTFYFGSTGGGVWKTTDAGITWHDLSAQAFASASIGAIDVADSDRNVIYVGTGSASIRSNVSIGKGIYKSTDAGKTWRFVGLASGASWCIRPIPISSMHPSSAIRLPMGRRAGSIARRTAARRGSACSSSPTAPAPPTSSSSPATPTSCMRRCGMDNGGRGPS